VERSLAGLVFCVDVGLMIDEDLEDVESAIECCDVERSAACTDRFTVSGVPLVRILSHRLDLEAVVADEGVAACGLTMGDGQVESITAFMVLRVGVGAEYTVEPVIEEQVAGSGVTAHGG